MVAKGEVVISNLKYVCSFNKGMYPCSEVQITILTQCCLLHELLDIRSLDSIEITHLANSSLFCNLASNSLEWLDLT